jgi:mono/diheme cytochrome c family protein
MKQPENLRTAGAHKGAGHIDYRETSDITQAHGAIQRERSLGEPGSVPVPMWLLAVSGVAIFWAGTYLGMFNGGFSSAGFDEMARGTRGPAPGQQQTAAAGGATQTPRDKGKRFFGQNCVSCHQATGLGVPGQDPPLAGSEYVNGGTKRLAFILLKGLQGSVTVTGKPFNGSMPAWSGQLTDEKIASILTYIRSEWGNTAPEVTPEQITAARKEAAADSDPMTEARLQAIPADANLEGGAGGGAPEVKK